ncbi:MAG TPA: hypothetical protein VG410_13345 [Solirubrobacteraceae bacterium]|nr:hypothetical protein [Solirubrobacteraceae bacterium]
MSFAAPALAARHRPATGCGAPAGSAINEYCDAIPSPTGGTVPHVGSPAVAMTLAPAAVHQINAAPLAERKLLRLPAPTRVRHRTRHRHAVSAASIGSATTSVWSLALTLILVLVAIALVLAGIAAERWRRRRA